MSLDQKHMAPSFKAVCLLAYPVMLAGISTPLLGLVDQTLLGQFADAAHIAALGLALVVMSYLFWGLNFISLGLSGHISQALGANNFIEQASKLRQFALLAMSICLLALGLSPLWIPYFSQLIDQSGQLTPLVETYLAIRIWALPAIVINLIGFGWSIGNQNTRIPMFIMLLCNATNMLLDWLFCQWFPSPMQAVALGSVLAEYLAASCYLVLLLQAIKRLPKLQFTQWWILAEFKSLLRSSSHFVLRSLFLLSVFAWFNYLSSANGANLVAVNSWFLMLLTLMATGLDGFAHAGEAMIGKAAGAKQMRHIKRIVGYSFWASLILALALAALMYFGAPLLFALMSDDSALHLLAKQYLIWLVVLPLLAFWGYWLDGLLTGLKASRAMRNQIIVSALLFFMISGWAASIWLNHGLWASLLLFLLIRALFGVVLLKIEIGKIANECFVKKSTQN